ncbi:MAG: tetratricopeptide repeat protein [Acidobacteria bacterium]|nr:tetratricopeptide repeat protein [Acidobacteriota bacterium]
MKRKFFLLFLAAVAMTAVSIAVPAKAQTMSELYNKAESNSMREIEKGKKELDAGKLKAAEKHFKEAAKLMKQNYQAYAYLGIVAFMKKDLKASLDWFKTSFDKFSVYKAYILERKRDYVRELERQQGNLRLELDKHDMQYEGINATAVETHYESVKNMLKDYKKQLEKDKNMKYPAFFHFKYGNALFAARKMDKAKEQYLAAVQTDPNFKDAYSNLAVCYFIGGDCPHAVQAYKKAKELKAKINPRFERDLKKRCGVQ